ncbi:sugar-binding transcriptional regulator [Kurthia sibirica]|uniref:DNA-binding transcriptional regulator n=1 Tax=Kurthia sibirica TaxID=202750 RepID=A0A2U3APG5_9BACL|nr:sugar-binding transcriptional regulator [Kurthia sibirica]PWI26427.1 DNA-binding transcriptional regulator [Kurthia sibirica]GEK32991.1 deoxyribonucleoside regulator [Kurthia sibirica]
MYSKLEMIQVAKLYYEMNLTQKEIADRLSYSRATISRIIDAAFKEGIIKVEINYTLTSLQKLETLIQEKYNLQKVVVLPVYLQERTLVLNDVGKAVAMYLDEICKEDSILGISWGTTLGHVAPYLKEKELPTMKIVQLNGGIAKGSYTTGSSALLERFAQVYKAESYHLPVPTIVDSAAIADVMKTDTGIQQVLQIGRTCNIALFGIGSISYESVLYKGGYFTENAYEDVIKTGGVGDICSRYFSHIGQIVDESLNARTIGLELEELRNKEHSIAIAVGKEKAQSVRGALNGGYVNTLFIDEELAIELGKREMGLNDESSKAI